MGIDASLAHNAAADVDMTIEIMKWASENIKNLPPPPKKTSSVSGKAERGYFNKEEIDDIEMTISANERKQILNEKIILYQADGKRLESREGFQAVLATSKKTNHILHLILSFFTGGLWLPVWLMIVLTRKKKRDVLQVDEYGMTSLKSAKD